MTTLNHRAAQFIAAQVPKLSGSEALEAVVLVKALIAEDEDVAELSDDEFALILRSLKTQASVDRNCSGGDDDELHELIFKLETVAT